MTLPDWILEIERGIMPVSVIAYSSEKDLRAELIRRLSIAEANTLRLLDALKIALEALETLADDPDELTLKCIQGQSPTAIRFIQAGCLISREALAKIRGDEK